MLRALALVGILAVHGVAAEAREVVFLLGADEPGKALFFAPAADFYRSHHADSHLVVSARSLAEVREYLVRQHAAMPWDRVTLVAHGAPWVGLEVSVFAGAEYAGLEALESAHATGEFPALPAGVIDARTQLVVESCGLGRRPDILDALVRLLSSTDGARMQVSSPSGFVAYRSGGGQSRRFELAFANAVVAQRTKARSASAVNAAKARLRAEMGPLALGAVEDVHPVHITIAIPATASLTRGNIRRHLHADSAVQRRLAAHGLTIDQLAWSIDQPAASTGQRIEGRADVVVLREALPAQ